MPLLPAACKEPMVFFNCSRAGPGAKGSECQRSCQTRDTQCVNCHWGYKLGEYHTNISLPIVVQSHGKCILVFYRSLQVHFSASQAACVPKACCMMVSETVLRRISVPVYTTECPTCLVRPSKWTVIPGNESYCYVVQCQIAFC